MKVLASLLLFFASTIASGQLLDPVPVIPTGNGEAVIDLLYARPFQLEVGYRYDFLADRPLVTRGVILVLEVDPEFARPRAVNRPVLYVGSVPAQICNSGYGSGRVIAIVPGSVDLKQTPIFYGSVELPERVTSERGARELAVARDWGFSPMNNASIDRARGRGGDPLFAGDVGFLHLEISSLIFSYASDETECAERYRWAVQ